ncbi:MAG: MarC family protein [Spirochaetales bacterium]|nr:MarC family protein [Spirochaetales bacterium]
MNFSLNELVLFQIALFAMFSPFAVIGPYSVFTEGYSRKIQRKIAFRAGFFSTIILIVSAWAGEALFRYLGISVAALGAAGGLILILSSLPMIMKGESPRKKAKPLAGLTDTDSSDDTEEDDEEWRTLVVSPLVFPLMVGAGSISLVVTQAASAGNVVDKLAISGCIIIHGLFVYATGLFSVPLANYLGGKGSAIITRIGGIILLSLAFIIFTNGLKELLPGLA